MLEKDKERIIVMTDLLRGAGAVAKDEQGNEKYCEFFNASADLIELLVEENELLKTKNAMLEDELEEVCVENSYLRAGKKKRAILLN